PHIATMSSLNSNPPSADLHVSTNGTDWLWAAFCFFAFVLIIIVIITITRPRGARLFHEMAVVILAISTITYFSLASGLGNAPAPVEFRGNGGEPTRQISYVRYIQWAINLPLLLLTLLLATGLPLSNIVITVFMGVIFVVMGLVGSLVHSTYKWGYFVFGVAALFFIWYVLLWHAPSMTFAAGGIVRRGYYVGAGFFSFILLTYPICWACSEGANVISVTSEMIWYGILDIFGGPIFLFILLFELRNVDYNAFGLQSGKY
ncbi:heat shock protein 30, partial [Laetiporus sulphureus 93-53]